MGGMVHHDSFAALLDSPTGRLLPVCCQLDFKGAAADRRGREQGAGVRTPGMDRRADPVGSLRALTAASGAVITERTAG
jgi:hypothetical protein